MQADTYQYAVRLMAYQTAITYPQACHPRLRQHEQHQPRHDHKGQYDGQNRSKKEAPLIDQASF